MNYSELQEVVRHILSESCKHCGGTYCEHDVQILSTTENEGVFFVICANCPSKLVINVKFKTPKTRKLKRQHRSLNIRRQVTEKINANDYLDIHNFLKDFQGDFKDYIK